MLQAGLLALALQVEVNGRPSCPEPAHVQAALQGLLDARVGGDLAGGAGNDHVAQIDSGDDHLVVRLKDRAGATLGERRVSAGSSCQERAQTAAVIIAALETRLPAPSEPVKLPGGAAAAPALTAAPGPASSAARELELSGLVVSTGESMAPGVRADLALLNRAPLVLRLAVSYTGALEHRVGTGVGRFSRWALTGGVGSRIALPQDFFFESGGEVVVSALRIAGQGFDANGSNTTFDPGLRLSARLGRGWRAVRICLLAGVGVWVRPQRVYVAGNAAQSSIPRLDALVGLGIGFPSGVTN